MKSSMHMVGTIVWLLTAVGCIHAGLVALGYDPLVLLRMEPWVHYAMMLFGVAGVVSLLMFFMGNCNCGSHCNCDSSPNNRN